MKRKRILLLLTIICFTLISCGNEKINVSESNNFKPVQSFGNQLNQHYSNDIFIKNEHEIYVTENKSIVKFDIENINTPQIIYEAETGTLGSVSVLDDWIYFIAKEETYKDANRHLYRMKKDGSEKTELLKKADFYIITDNDIYYEQGIMKESCYLGVMNLDGSNKRKILKGDYALVGIDNQWIYYYKNKDEDSYLYRMKADGSKSEKAFNVEFKNDDITIGDFVVDKNQVFFTCFYDTNSEKKYLAKKIPNEKETVLSTGVLFTSLNKAGNWIFYSDLNCVYKMNVNEKGKAQLLYTFEGKDDDGIVRSILLNNGDALVTSQGNKSVYIKKDGTVIDLGVVLQREMDE